MWAHPGRKEGAGRAWEQEIRAGRSRFQGEEGGRAPGLIRAGGMCPGVLSGLTAPMLRGLSTAQAWSVSDSVTLGHWHAMVPQGPPAPGTPQRREVLPESWGEHPAPAPRLFVFVHKRETFLQDQRVPLPAPCSQHPTPGAGLLLHLLLTYLSWC